jgi:hypothetical protein
VLDWKTRDTEEGKTIDFYDDLPIQLVAYAEGYINKEGVIPEEEPRLISAVISRTEPGRVEHYEWPVDDYWKYFGVFQSAFNIWQYKNNLDPSWEE